MPTIYSISILENNKNKKQVFNLSQFSFFYRSTVKNLLSFFSETFTSKTKRGEVISTHHEGYKITCFQGTDYAVCVISSEIYNDRIIYEIIKIATLDNLETLIKDYQHPEKVDKITKINQELEETIDILHKTIEEVLNRGENLDELVAKSQELSDTSKAFYKEASKQNRCCTIS